MEDYVGEQLPISGTETVQGKASKGIIEPDGFKTFYGVYPNRKSRGDALKAWLALNPGEKMEKEIMWGLREQIRSWRKKKDLNNKLPERSQKFIPEWPYPATYLRGFRWMDDIDSSDEIAEKFSHEAHNCECGNPGTITIENIWYCAKHYDRKFNASHYDFLYKNLKKMGMGKTVDETKEQYYARCREWCLSNGIVKNWLK